MIKFYVSENLDRVLTEIEYKALLQREVEEYGYSSIEDAEEHDTDYTKMIEFEESLEGKIYEIDNIIQGSIYDIHHIRVNSMCENASDTLESKNFSYQVIDNWYININFDILELDKENLDNSAIKVTKIELI